MGDQLLDMNPTERTPNHIVFAMRPSITTGAKTIFVKIDGFSHTFYDQITILPFRTEPNDISYKTTDHILDLDDVIRELMNFPKGHGVPESDFKSKFEQQTNKVINGLFNVIPGANFWALKIERNSLYDTVARYAEVKYRFQSYKKALNFLLPSDRFRSDRRPFATQFAKDVGEHFMKHDISLFSDVTWKMLDLAKKIPRFRTAMNIKLGTTKVLTAMIDNLVSTDDLTRKLKSQAIVRNKIKELLSFGWTGAVVNENQNTTTYHTYLTDVIAGISDLFDQPSNGTIFEVINQIARHSEIQVHVFSSLGLNSEHSQAATITRNLADDLKDVWHLHESFSRWEDTVTAIADYGVSLPTTLLSNVTQFLNRLELTTIKHNEDAATTGKRMGEPCYTAACYDTIESFLRIAPVDAGETRTSECNTLDPPNVDMQSRIFSSMSSKIIALLSINGGKNVDLVQQFLQGYASQLTSNPRKHLLEDIQCNADRACMSLAEFGRSAVFRDVALNDAAEISFIFEKFTSLLDSTLWTTVTTTVGPTAAPNAVDDYVVYHVAGNDTLVNLIQSFLTGEVVAYYQPYPNKTYQHQAREYTNKVFSELIQKSSTGKRRIITAMKKIATKSEMIQRAVAQMFERKNQPVTAVIQDRYPGGIENAKGLKELVTETARNLGSLVRIPMNLKTTFNAMINELDHYGFISKMNSREIGVEFGEKQTNDSLTCIAAINSLLSATNQRLRTKRLAPSKVREAMAAYGDRLMQLIRQNVQFPSSSLGELLKGLADGANDNTNGPLATAMAQLNGQPMADARTAGSEAADFDFAAFGALESERIVKTLSDGLNKLANQEPVDSAGYWWVAIVVGIVVLLIIILIIVLCVRRKKRKQAEIVESETMLSPSLSTARTSSTQCQSDSTQASTLDLCDDIIISAIIDVNPRQDSLEGGKEHEVSDHGAVEEKEEVGQKTMDEKSLLHVFTDNEHSDVTPVKPAHKKLAINTKKCDRMKQTENQYPKKSKSSKTLEKWAVKTHTKPRMKNIENINDETEDDLRLDSNQGQGHVTSVNQEAKSNHNETDIVLVHTDHADEIKVDATKSVVLENGAVGSENDKINPREPQVKHTASIVRAKSLMVTKVISPKHDDMPTDLLTFEKEKAAPKMQNNGSHDERSNSDENIPSDKLDNDAVPRKVNHKKDTKIRGENKNRLSDDPDNPSRKDPTSEVELDEIVRVKPVKARKQQKKSLKVMNSRKTKRTTPDEDDQNIIEIQKATNVKQSRKSSLQAKEIDRKKSKTKKKILKDQNDDVESEIKE